MAASLRNIMNMEDEEADPYQQMGPGDARHHQHPQAHQHHHGMPVGYPPEGTMYGTSVASGSRRGSEYSVHSQGHEYAQHPGHPNVASSSRHGAEMMEYDYAQEAPYGQQDPYGGAHLRSAAVPGSPSEYPVKRTPITGRVSRAKKGIPVHTCEECHPPKTFTRAEHLRRHKLSHQPPELNCRVPGCNKSFHRKDLLDRHQQRHEHDEGTGRGETPSSQYGDYRGSSHADSRGRGSMHHQSSQGHGSSGRGGQWSASHDHASSISGSAGRMGHSGMHQHHSNYYLPPVQNTYDSMQPLFNTSPDMKTDKTSGWDPSSNSTGNSLSLRRYTASNPQAFRTAAMRLPISKSTGMLMTMMPVDVSNPVVQGYSCGSARSANRKRLHSSGHSATCLWPGIEEYLPLYLELYWEKVDALYPIVHKQLFERAKGEAREHPSALQCAMGAIATQFLSHRNHRAHGSHLHLYADRKLKETLRLDQKGGRLSKANILALTDEEWPLEVMQTVLLVEYYSMLQGSDKDVYVPSQLFEVLYDKVCISR